VAAQEPASARRWSQGATTGQSHVAAREPASAGRQSQGATTGSEPSGGTGALLSREAEPSQAQNRVAAWEPASAGRWSQGATIGSEPRGGMGARLNREAELGPEATWRHRAHLYKEAGPWSQRADVDPVV
jgi:hypothetical protein